MICPQDGAELWPIDYEGVVVHTCESCGGELFTAHDLSHIPRVRDAHVEFVLRGLLENRRPIVPVPVDNAKRRMMCPCCKKGMQVVDYDGEVQADRCLSCGAMWLSGHALSKIEALMQRWQYDGPSQLFAVASQLEITRRKTAEAASDQFQGTRFMFVNAVINNFMEALV
jgi:Zn-finger nucleic acid-binding protein